MADKKVDSILLEISATTDKAGGEVSKTIKDLKSLKKVTEGIDTNKLESFRDAFKGFATVSDGLKKTGDGMRSVSSAIRSMSKVDSTKLNEISEAVNKIGVGLGNLGSNNKISIRIDSDGIDKAVKPLQEAQAAAAWSEPYKDRHTDSWMKRTSAANFYRVMRGLGVECVSNHADFRLMSALAMEDLLDYTERNLFLRGIVAQLGYKQDKVYYDRRRRTAGYSKYPFMRMLDFAIDGITSFSVRPVYRNQYL